MLIHPPDEPGTENQEACQRYEVMQCFTVSQPKSIQEDGEGEAQNHCKVIFFLQFERTGTELIITCLLILFLVTILYITEAIQFAIYVLLLKKNSTY